MTSERDIEANLHKVKVVLILANPRFVKDIQRLNGCIATLGRFISKSTKKCMLFFKALRLSAKTFRWDKNCTQTWNDLKIHLKELLLMCSPSTGETLYLYLSASNQVVTLVLIKEENNQQSIYFMSKVLHGVETLYSLIEKVTFALVIAARNFRAYFESHLIVVYTNYPLEQIFYKLDQSRRILKWSIKLCGLEITFVPWTVIKVQALADFLAEYSFSDTRVNFEEEFKSGKADIWSTKVDDAINSKGVGIGMVITSPHSKYEGY